MLSRAFSHLVSARAGWSGDVSRAVIAQGSVRPVATSEIACSNSADRVMRRRASSKDAAITALRWSRARRSRRAARPHGLRPDRRSRCLSIASARASIPRGSVATVSTTGASAGISPPGLRLRDTSEPSASAARNSATVSEAPGRSALLTAKTSPISRIPALLAWMPSPQRG